MRGTGPGTRAASLQINQAYVVLLAAQFQGFCRDLHDECIRAFVVPLSIINHRIAIQLSLQLNRKLDRGNPNPSNIGSDFGRFGLSFWPLVEAHHSQNPARKTALDELNDWRNAIAHHDFPTTMLKGSRLQLTLGQVQKWRKACNQLASSFDDVLFAHLHNLFGRSPW